MVQAGKRDFHDDDTLYWQVKQFIKKRDNKPGDAFLGVIHRLDRPASGIVLMAKTSKGAARLSEQFRERTMDKTYHIVVHGTPVPASATLRHTLWKDHDLKKAIVGTEGEESILHYETIKSSGEFSLLKIKLETGRFHQIRAQLSAIGHPVVGDTKYGAPKALSDQSIMLCATGLEFRAATTDEIVKISIEVPAEWGLIF